MENVLFNENLKEIQENIEKHKQIFLNTKENTKFIVHLHPAHLFNLTSLSVNSLPQHGQVCLLKEATILC